MKCVEFYFWPENEEHKSLTLKFWFLLLLCFFPSVCHLVTSFQSERVLNYRCCPLLHLPKVEFSCRGRTQVLFRLESN